MKRTTSKRQILPAFRLTVGQVEILERELRSLFQGKVGSHFSVRVASDEYQFATAEEIRGVATLPAVVRDFSLWVSASVEGDHRHVFLHGRSPSLSVEASDYGWCEAVVATCLRAMRPYRRWYSVLRAWHFGVLASLAGVLPSGQLIFSKGETALGIMGTVVWFLLAVSLWVIFFAFDRVFPPVSLVIREEESWARRYTPELTLILSMAALLVAVLTFLFK